MWFRRDLRLADNPALVAASESDSVTPLFVVDSKLFANAGGPRQNYLVAALQSLDASMGNGLVLRHGDPVIEVARLAKEIGATSVFATGDCSPIGIQRDRNVELALKQVGVAFRAVATPYAIAPGTVRNGSGNPYKVFTPFRNTWAAHCWPEPSGNASLTWRGAPEVQCDGYPEASSVTSGILDAIRATASEQSAHQRLEEFVNEWADSYVENRNLPAIDGTSRLSAALHFGILHPRQILAKLNRDPGANTVRSELAWREFYADVLWHQPTSAYQCLNPAMEAMECDTDARALSQFQAWCKGETGFPIVDAGMRQLLTTGWMHNRVRMITASFLVKDLHLPWQWGARHFMRHLIDGDTASNSHGWQWVAGSGTDASPYYRVFNPTTQSERFDPAGDYIRAYVPELSELSNSAIHAPTAKGGSAPLGYMYPVVDHDEERRESLRRYGLTKV